MTGLSSFGVGSFAQVLHDRAGRLPDALAFRFVLDDGRAREVSYADLDLRARTVAAAILAATQGSPRPALLLYEPGLDYLAGLFGCFYAGIPAVPAFPPGATRLPRTMSRLLSIVEDADAGLVLTTAKLAPGLREWLGSVMTGRVMTGRAAGSSMPLVLATDEDGESGQSPAFGQVLDGPSPSPSPDSVAVLQYTSGSTSLPRGVMLTNAQLMANCEIIARAFDVRDGSSGVLWLPPYHDMGLIGGILTPVVAEMPVTFMAPTTFLRRPMAWLRTVSRYRATHTGGPNFAFDLALRRLTEADLEDLDLSSLELVFTGAEPVRPDTLERFVERFAPHGLRADAVFPCYGLAEATLYVTGRHAASAATGEQRLSGWRTVSVARDALELDAVARPAMSDEPARRLVGCGTPGLGTGLVIVDPESREPVESGGVGEIWVASPCVADGYWRRPDETADAFGARTADGHGPFLRTGDLGFLLDGELFVVGRMKDLIVLNGRNHHPVDIEQVCEAAVPGIRRGGGAAFAVEDDESAAERLVVVYEAEVGIGELGHREAIDGIRRAVSRELNLPPHTVVLVSPRTTPKTSSGKVQRWLCRRQFLAGDLKELARWQAPPDQRAVPAPRRPQSGPQQRGPRPDPLPSSGSQPTAVPTGTGRSPR